MSKKFNCNDKFYGFPASSLMLRIINSTFSEFEGFWCVGKCWLMLNLKFHVLWGAHWLCLLRSRRKNCGVLHIFFVEYIRRTDNFKYRWLGVERSYIKSRKMSTVTCSSFGIIDFQMRDENFVPWGCFFSVFSVTFWRYWILSFFLLMEIVFVETVRLIENSFSVGQRKLLYSVSTINPVYPKFADKNFPGFM